MKLALTRGTNELATSPGSGWLLWMRSWFTTLPTENVTLTPSQPETALPVTGDINVTGAQVLSFPYRGDALLVKLAEILRERLANSSERVDLFTLTLARAPRLRLSIDESAHVEFDPLRFTFGVVVAVEPGTQLTLDTGDFDTLVRFVVQYVQGKLVEAFEPEGVI